MERETWRERERERETWRKNEKGTGVVGNERGRDWKREREREIAYGERMCV